MIMIIIIIIITLNNKNTEFKVVLMLQCIKFYGHVVYSYEIQRGRFNYNSRVYDLFLVVYAGLQHPHHTADDNAGDV